MQDVPKKAPKEIKRAMCAARGIGPRTAHMLLMYAGNDDYVKGDVHVCRFVADALGVNHPRALDARIWTLGAGAE